jgi:glucose-6-phosphate isomerase
MDLLKVMAMVLAAQQAVEENNPELAKLGKHWIANFLNRHPTLAAKYSTQLDRQRAMANNVQSLRDNYHKLQRLLQKNGFQSNDIYNMVGEGLILHIQQRQE